MADEVAPISEQELREHRRAAEFTFGGALLSGIVAIGVAVLAIIGLANMIPSILVSIAVIAFGVALISEGLAIGARMTDLLYQSGEGTAETEELSLGLTNETLAGLAGVVLGILALLNLHPMILVATAVIVFGGSLILGGGVTARLNVADVTYRGSHPMVRTIAQEALYATTSLQMLAGLSAITLGILAIAGIYPLLLVLVALLVLAGTFLLTNTALATRMLGTWR